MHGGPYGMHGGPWTCSKRVLCCLVLAVLTIACVALSTKCSVRGCASQHRARGDSGKGDDGSDKLIEARGRKAALLEQDMASNALANWSASDAAAAVRSLRHEVALVVVFNNGPISWARAYVRDVGLCRFFHHCHMAGWFSGVDNLAAGPAAQAALESFVGAPVTQGKTCDRLTHTFNPLRVNASGMCKHILLAQVFRREAAVKALPPRGYLILSDDAVVVDFAALAQRDRGATWIFANASRRVVMLPPPEAFWWWGSNNSGIGAGCVRAFSTIPTHWWHTLPHTRERGGQAWMRRLDLRHSILPGCCPTNTDMFYLTTDAAALWPSVAGHFSQCMDEVALGPLAILTSAHIDWAEERLAKWQLWQVERLYETIQPRLALHPPFLSPRVHTTIEAESFKHVRYDPSLATRRAEDQVRYVEGNPHLMLAHPLKLSTNYIRRWTILHYEANYRIWFGAQAAAKGGGEQES